MLQLWCMPEGQTLGEDVHNFYPSITAANILATMLSAVRTQARPFTASRRPAVLVQARMSLAVLVDDLNKTQMKADAPKVEVGDSVRIGLAVQVNSNHQPFGNAAFSRQTIPNMCHAASYLSPVGDLSFRTMPSGLPSECVLVPCGAACLSSLWLNIASSKRH